MEIHGTKRILALPVQEHDASIEDKKRKKDTRVDIGREGRKRTSERKVREESKTDGERRQDQKTMDKRTRRKDNAIIVKNKIDFMKQLYNYGG